MATPAAAPALADVPALADALPAASGPRPDPGGGATDPERFPASIIDEYFICAAFWGAPTTVDAPALAWPAEADIVATWSPVKCTIRSAIHGDSPATRRISRPVISSVIAVSGVAPAGEPMPPKTPSPMTKMMIRISLEKTSASMASSHLRTQPRERSATPPAKARGAKIAVMMISIFLITSANHTIATAQIATSDRMRTVAGLAMAVVNTAPPMILVPSVAMVPPVAIFTTPTQSWSTPARSTSRIAKVIAQPTVAITKPRTARPMPPASCFSADSAV